MIESWKETAEEILGELQAKVTARDLAGLLELFEDPAVVIGAAGDGRTSDGRRESKAPPSGAADRRHI